MNYVGFGPRLVAALIDGAIIFAINFILGFVLGLAGVSSESAILNIISLVISIGYVVFYQSQTGQTIGKKVMKIKVVTLNGQKPSAFTFFLRDVVGKFISGLILGIGYLWMLWDGKKQALHDKIASTYVVKV